MDHARFILPLHTQKGLVKFLTQYDSIKEIDFQGSGPYLHIWTASYGFTIMAGDRSEERLAENLPVDLVIDRIISFCNLPISHEEFIVKLVTELLTQ